MADNNFFNNIDFARNYQNKGLWLSKKSSENLGVGWKLDPGFDLFHSVLKINAHLYEGTAEKKVNAKTTEAQHYINRLKRNRLMISLTKSRLQLIEKYERSRKSHFRVPYELGTVCDKENYQQFVLMSKYFDIGVINPLTWPRRIVNHIVSALSDKKKGIWLGKKSLKNLGIGCTVAPGFDLFHWAIIIDGHLYEVTADEKENAKANGEFKTTNDLRYINQFDWTRLIGNSTESHLRLIEKCERSRKPYFLVPYELGMVNDNMNCQQFVHMLYGYARAIPVFKATLITNIISGNILL